MGSVRAKFAFLVAFTFLATAVHAELSEHKAPLLPSGALAQLWAPTSDETAAVAPLAFSPDQRLLALASGPHVVLWDVASGKELRQLKGHKDSVTALAFAPDGSTIASAGRDRVLVLWDAATGKEQRRLEGHTDAVLAVVFASEGKQLASAGQDHTVRLWDPADGSLVCVLQGHQNYVHALAYTPDGKRLASAGKDRTIRLWDAATGKEQRQWKGHQNRVNVLLFSSDGTLLFSASQDSTARVWDTAAGKERRRFGGWCGEMKAMALSADDRTLATVGRDQLVRLWEVETGEQRHQFSWDGGDFLSLALSGDGRMLASGRPGSAVLWDVTGLSNDGKSEAIEMTQSKLEGFWSALAKDAAGAHRAIWKMAAVPDQAVPFVAKQLETHRGFDDPKRIARFITDLSDDRFAVRAHAADELEALGQLVRDDLEKELAKHPTLDVRKRIEQLQQRMEAVAVPPAWLRVLRAVEVLEHCGTEEARQALRKLGDGPAGSRLTREAQASLRRLEHRR
jgi:dipeptidyl aminopeptidase/acylaminoacyl peptidase